MPAIAFLAPPGPGLLLHVAIATAVVIAILGLAALLRAPGRDGFGVYESGAAPGAPVRGMAVAQYFLIAAIFMLFDVEVALLLAWAVAAREAGLGGLIAATVFIALLLTALAWLWMDARWRPDPRGGAKGMTMTHDLSRPGEERPAGDRMAMGQLFTRLDDLVA